LKPPVDVRRRRRGEARKVEQNRDVVQILAACSLGWWLMADADLL
jgi:hypothetical protein